jgi:hypothetical protein
LNPETGEISPDRGNHEMRVTGMDDPSGGRRPGGIASRGSSRGCRRVRLVAAVHAGMDAGLQVLCERCIDSSNSVYGGADSHLHGDPGTFLAGAGRARTSAEACGAGELVQECVAFCAYRIQPADVGPLLRLGELSRGRGAVAGTPGGLCSSRRSPSLDSVATPVPAATRSSEATGWCGRRISSLR